MKVFVWNWFYQAVVSNNLLFFTCLWCCCIVFDPFELSCCGKSQESLKSRKKKKEKKITFPPFIIQTFIKSIQSETLKKRWRNWRSTFCFLFLL